MVYVATPNFSNQALLQKRREWRAALTMKKVNRMNKYYARKLFRPQLTKSIWIALAKKAHRGSQSRASEKTHLAS